MLVGRNRNFCLGLSYFSVLRSIRVGQGGLRGMIDGNRDRRNSECLEDPLFRSQRSLEMVWEVN